MGIAALGPKPRTTKSARGHNYSLSAARSDDRASEPGLVRRHHLYPDRPRLPLSRGDHGLGEPCGAGVAAVEHHGQRIRSVAALEEALARFGRPEDLQHRPGLSVHLAAFTGVLADAGVRISMDGRGRWMDNVFIERLWRSLKHEDIYLKGYADGREAHIGIASWFAFTTPASSSGARPSLANDGLARSYHSRTRPWT